MIEKKMTEQDWQQKLTQEQFEICRCKGTEAPFSGRYNDCKDDGVYHCSCCDSPLFDSKCKYDSGSGWPSFWDVIEKRNLEYLHDTAHGMQRTEIICKSCGAHLGHVFEDGPPPTGLRYCINSVSLNLKDRV